MLAVLGALILGGCHGCHGSSSSTERPITMNPLVRFDAKFTRSDKELVLTYEVENRSARDLYMLDRVELKRPYRPDPNVVYVHFDHDTRTVWLNKRIHSEPYKEGRRGPPPIFPDSTPLRAGSTVREEIRVPLPIREFRAFEQVTPESELTATTYHEVYFTLQYFWRTDGMTEGSYEIDGQKVLTTNGKLTEADFGLLETPRVALDLPVLEPRR